MMLGFLLLGCSFLGIGAFALYPIMLRFLALFLKQSTHQDEQGSWSITVLLAVRNARPLLEEKLQNLRDAHWPGAVQILIYSDGSTDGTEEYLGEQNLPGMELLVTEQHRGKAWCLSQMLPQCRGEILVFTDADALFAPDAVRCLTAHFADPKVGGVCGQRFIRASNALVTPQQDYIGLDSWIKEAESALGSLTSNDGKLYAIRRHLARAVPGPVTDDLWEAMGVVIAGYRFVFEPGAWVSISAPARNLSHEFSRRRRVVSTSLTGIWRSWQLLNPFRYGWYGPCLFINKVDRRLLPVWLLGLLVSCLILAPYHWLFVAAAGIQVCAYSALVIYHFCGMTRIMPKSLGKLADKCVYFLVGNLGMLLGLIDFLRGKTPSQWEPKKGSS